MTDNSGNATSYTYNVLNQVTQITLPDPDDTGPLTAPFTSYAYDSYHRLSQITDPESGNTYFTYDVSLPRP